MIIQKKWKPTSTRWLVYISVHNSFVHNSHKLETIQKSISRWMDKLIMVVIHIMGYYSPIKRNELLTNFKIIMHVKETINKSTYYMIPFIYFFKKQTSLWRWRTSQQNEGWTAKEHEEPFRGNGMFCRLILAVVSWYVYLNYWVLHSK